MRRVLFIVFAMLTVVASMSHAFSQTGDQVVVKIALDEPTFSERQKTKLRITIENRTGKAISDDTTTLHLYLSTHGTDLGACTIDDCFNTYVFLSKSLREGQVAESELNLVGLSWRAFISAFSQGWPNNMFKVVPPGEYQLFVRLATRLDKSDLRSIETLSNVLPVTVAGKR